MDLRPVRREDDRAIHLRELVEHRGRVVDLQLDPAGIEKGQLLAVPDADERPGARLDDVVDALPDRRARRDHLERPDQPGLLPCL
jgi:hypothetical protein